MESINGNESVDDLLAMVNRQDDPSGVIALICLTTAMTNPATFRQFSIELKNKHPEIYEKHKDALNISNKNTSNKKSGCFIATATMRDYNHPIVLDLRNFRDMYLLKSLFGQLLVKIYYRFSPTIAKIILKNSFCRQMTLIFLIKPIHKLITKLFNVNGNI